jgi:hypothetical protein
VLSRCAFAHRLFDSLLKQPPLTKIKDIKIKTEMIGDLSLIIEIPSLSLSHSPVSCKAKAVTIKAKALPNDKHLLNKSLDKIRSVGCKIKEY